MILPKITKKQLEIVNLFPKYRFLNRLQIQAFLNHKNKKRINTWLPDLVTKTYLKRIYSTNFGERTKPAIYYLGINGIRLLRDKKNYSPDFMARLYREKDRSQEFIDEHILLGDICLHLESKSKSKGAPSFFWVYTESEFEKSDPPLNFLIESELEIQPKLVVEKETRGKSAYWYILEIFESSLPRYRIRKRMRSYIKFYFSNEWENHVSSPFPTILFACPDKQFLIWAKRFTKKLLDEEQSPESLSIRFATKEKIKEIGVTGEIWEEV